LTTVVSFRSGGQDWAAALERVQWALGARDLLPLLEEQLQRLAAEGDRLSVPLCDIDRFRQVNDTRGHAAGDQVLRVAAALAMGGPGPPGRHGPVRGQGGRPRPGGGRTGGRIATLHTGRPGCGKIPMTGSSPTRHRETGILADQQVIGKVGRVTGTIAPERVGEVMIPIRGGSEAFNAYAADTQDTISTGTRVVVVEYFPPRTVVVSPL
jgi:hypothetical protein